MRDDGRRSLDLICEPFLQRPRDVGVNALATAAQQRDVSRIQDQAHRSVAFHQFSEDRRSGGDSNRMPLADAFAGMGHFSIEREYLLRDSDAGLSIVFMNRDALFGDPLANDRVDHRASANRAYSLSVCLTWI